MKVIGIFRSAILLMSVMVHSFAFSACISDDDPTETWSLPMGSKMPQFEVTLLDGTKVSTSSLEGKTAVIVLFNTSCPDCRAELPVVNEVQQKIIDDQTVCFLCIARAEGAETIEQFWKEHSLTLPVSPQPDRAVYSLFAESVIPRIMLFSPSGHLCASYTDAPMPTAQSLLAAIRSAAE